MADYNTLRLCRQVEDALVLALSGEDLALEAVEPAPSASRLLVTVIACDPRAAVERLATLHARLRADVASAIRRRRVPELAFRVMMDER
jgi:ribosome-binding factor A